MTRMERCFMRWGFGPLCVGTVLLNFFNFSVGLKCLAQGNVLCGVVEIVVSTLLGGLNVSYLRWWWQFRKTLRKPAMIPDTTFRAVYDHFAHAAVAEFNETGAVPPRFFAVTLGGDLFSAIFAIPPAHVIKFYRDEHGKTKIKALIHILLAADSPLRQIALKAGAEVPDLVVQIMTAWTTRHTVPAGAAVDCRNILSPDEDPARQEGIAIYVHSLTHTVIGVCPIAERQATYAPCDGQPLFGCMLMDPSPATDATIVKH